MTARVAAIAFGVLCIVFGVRMMLASPTSPEGMMSSVLGLWLIVGGIRDQLDGGAAAG